MAQGNIEQRITDLGEMLDRRWRWVVIAMWLIYCAWFVYTKWAGINSFWLIDTDDNLRMSQVRALLAGQDWYDLRQYRLNAPAGADIHWSRFVDLPLAGLIVATRPFLGPYSEMVGAAVAPMLPLLLLVWSIALTARRLIDRRAYPLALIALFFAGSTAAMFMPMRIDHHGWQLALLSLMIAGLADPRRARGGATVGIASALSLAIGLELLIYLALAGCALVLFWIDDRDQRRRLAAYALTLSGGTALSFLLFASYANRAPICDALSPVWLSDALVGGALLFVMAMLSPNDWKRRLAFAVAAGLVIAAFHALMWPDCLSRLEGVSAEVERLWLSHVREARPVYRHGWRTAAFILTLPVTGGLGWLLLIWMARSDRDRLRRTLAAALPAFTATALLFWQTRTGPAAQMMSIVGAAGLVWILTPWALALKTPVVRVFAPAAVIVLGLGGTMAIVDQFYPSKPPTERDRAISKANRLCNSMASFRPINQLPKGTIFTFVDLGPRTITVTRHNAIIGPYHRNGEQIADVMNLFRESPERARVLIGKYRADYLMTCPMSSSSTIFMSEAPKGFYAQLTRGQVPAWLTPVPLPPDSPFKLWKVAR
ncbi:MAG TPA: AcrB/AcrD/AcrF family protein [Sphingomicrobium sp.]